LANMYVKFDDPGLIILGFFLHDYPWEYNLDLRPWKLTDISSHHGSSVLSLIILS
jgi:hypothetical protein